LLAGRACRGPPHTIFRKKCPFREVGREWAALRKGGPLSLARPAGLGGSSGCGFLGPRSTRGTLDMLGLKTKNQGGIMPPRESRCPVGQRVEDIMPVRSPRAARGVGPYEPKKKKKTEAPRLAWNKTELQVAARRCPVVKGD